MAQQRHSIGIGCLIRVFSGCVHTGCSVRGGMSFLTFNFLVLIFGCMCVCARRCAHTAASVWKSDDSSLDQFSLAALWDPKSKVRSLWTHAASSGGPAVALT